MSINYTFYITSLQVAPTGSDGDNNVVTHVGYSYKGVNENGISGSFLGTTPIPSPSGSFIPFNELTEEEVVNWLEVVSDKPHMQNIIQQQINNQINPQNIPAPLPWNSGSINF